MTPTSPWRAALDWLAMRPVYAAYRLVWVAAKFGHPDARDVYRAMWKAQLDLPVIPSLTGAA